METESADLVRSGAATVVGLMATDGWAAASWRVAALLRRSGRSGDGADSVDHELEQERGEVVAARDHHDGTAIADLEVVWRTRLRRLLREDPTAATALRELIAEGSF